VALDVLTEEITAAFKRLEHGPFQLVLRRGLDRCSEVRSQWGGEAADQLRERL